MGIFSMLFLAVLIVALVYAIVSYNNLVNLFGSNSPPLGAYTFAVVFGFDTPLLAAGLFIRKFLR